MEIDTKAGEITEICRSMGVISVRIRWRCGAPQWHRSRYAVWSLHANVYGPIRTRIVCRCRQFPVSMAMQDSIGGQIGVPVAQTKPLAIRRTSRIWPMQRRSPLTALQASVSSRRFEIRSINSHGRSRASGENSAKLAARRLCVDRECSDDSCFDENYVPATLNLAQSFLDRRS